jgi:hypothetical protein
MVMTPDESRADFADKLSMVPKELKETRGWLRFNGIAELSSEKRITPLLDEAGPSIRIVAGSIIAAKSRLRRVSNAQLTIFNE